MSNLLNHSLSSFLMGIHDGVDWLYDAPNRNQSWIDAMATAGHSLNPVGAIKLAVFFSRVSDTLLEKNFNLESLQNHWLHVTMTAWCNRDPSLPLFASSEVLDSLHLGLSLSARSFTQPGRFIPKTEDVSEMAIKHQKMMFTKFWP